MRLFRKSFCKRSFLRPQTSPVSAHAQPLLSSVLEQYSNWPLRTGLVLNWIMGRFLSQCFAQLGNNQWKKTKTVPWCNWILHLPRFTRNVQINVWNRFHFSDILTVIQGYIYTLLDGFLFLHGQSIRYSMNRTGESRSRTSNFVPERMAERAWWPKCQSSLLNIHLRLSCSSVPPRLAFATCGTV